MPRKEGAMSNADGLRKTLQREFPQKIEQDLKTITEHLLSDFTKEEIARMCAIHFITIERSGIFNNRIESLNSGQVS